MRLLLVPLLVESTKKESYYTQIEKRVQTLEESQVCVLTSASAQYGRHGQRGKKIKQKKMLLKG